MEDFGVLWVYGFCGDSRGFFCWYGMGAGTEMQSARQPDVADVVRSDARHAPTAPGTPTGAAPSLAAEYESSQRRRSNRPQSGRERDRRCETHLSTRQLDKSTKRHWRPPRIPAF